MYQFRAAAKIFMFALALVLIPTHLDQKSFSPSLLCAQGSGECSPEFESFCELNGHTLTDHIWVQ